MHMAANTMNISIDPQLKVLVESLRAQGIYAQDLILEAINARRGFVQQPNMPVVQPAQAPPPVQAPATPVEQYDDSFKILARVQADAQVAASSNMKAGMEMARDMSEMMMSMMPQDPEDEDPWDRLPPPIQSAIMRALGGRQDPKAPLSSDEKRKVGKIMEGVK